MMHVVFISEQNILDTAAYIFYFFFWVCSCKKRRDADVGRQKQCSNLVGVLIALRIYAETQ